MSRGVGTMGALIAAVSGLSGLLFGYNTAVIAGALEFVAADFELATMGKQLLVSSILFGAFVGALASGPLTGRFGQRRLLRVAGVLFVLCALGLALAGGAWQAGLWRAALGLAVGIVSMVGPLYVAETASADRRGALVSLFQLGVTLGILISYLVGYALADAADWRLMMGLGAIPGAILLLGLVGLPESPRWLALKGRAAEARTALTRLRGGAEVDAELAEISHAEVTPLGWRALFGSRLWPVLLVAAGLFMFQNLSGIDGILYYAPEIFRDVGLREGSGAILATAGLGSINVAATVVAMAVVDRLGRRPLLLAGVAVMTVSLLVMSYMLGSEHAVVDPESATPAEWVTVICLGVYIAAFAFSLGPLPYVLMSEVFPLAARGRGMALASATAWGLNMLVSMTFLLLLEGFGTGGTFLLYAGVCAVALVFAFGMVPETKGRSLEQIEANLHAGRRTRDLGAVV